MKRNPIIALVYLLSILIFAGCVQNKNRQFENMEQQNFDNFLSKNYALSLLADNEIQKKEFFEKFEGEIYKYVDSVGLFVNWKGTINSIKTETSDKSTILSFEIYYQPEDTRKITFSCTHIVNTDSLKSDYIYNKVKNISDLSEVYFDGFIRTYNSNQISYGINYSLDNQNVSNPNYNFWITDIGLNERSDSLSNNLKAVINYNYKMILPLKNLFLKNISKEESDFQIKALQPKYNELKSKLTIEEIQYSNRFNTNLVYNFLYGD